MGTPLLYFPERDARDVSHDEETDSHRRNDHPYHEGGTDRDAEPDRIIAQLENHRGEYGGGKDHEGEVINKGATRQINKMMTIRIGKP